MFTILVGVIVGLLAAGAISFMSEFKKIALVLKLINKTFVFSYRFILWLLAV
jgi:hypothetical protein